MADAPKRTSDPRDRHSIAFRSDRVAARGGSIDASVDLTDAFWPRLRGRVGVLAGLADAETPLSDCPTHVMNRQSRGFRWAERK